MYFKININMSKWSYCNAIINVYTYNDIPNFKELIDVVLENAPKITGGENNCVYTAIDFMQGRSSSFPCNKCPIFCDTITKRTKKYCPGINSGYLTKKDIQNCLLNNLDFKFQNSIMSYYDRCKIVISDMHGLRDKTKDETIKEFDNFIKYLKTIFNKAFKVEIVCKKIL